MILVRCVGPVTASFGRMSRRRAPWHATDVKGASACSYDSLLDEAVMPTLLIIWTDQSRRVIVYSSMASLFQLSFLPGERCCLPSEFWCMCTDDVHTIMEW